MAIQFVGFATATGTSITPPAATRTGDMMIVSATNASSATFVTTAAGYTNKTSGSGTGYAQNVSFKFATSDSEAASTWTNATHISMVVYRDTTTNTLSTGTPTIQGGFSSNFTTGSSLNLPTGTAWSQKQTGSSKSWVCVMLQHSTATNLVKDLPNLTLRSDSSVPSVAIWDTNGGCANFAAQTVTVNASTKFGYAIFEVYNTGYKVNNYQTLGVQNGMSMTEKIR